MLLPATRPTRHATLRLRPGLMTRLKMPLVSRRLPLAATSLMDLVHREHLRCCTVLNGRLLNWAPRRQPLPRNRPSAFTRTGLFRDSLALSCLTSISRRHHYHHHRHHPILCIYSPFSHCLSTLLSLVALNTRSVYILSHWFYRLTS